MVLLRDGEISVCVDPGFGAFRVMFDPDGSDAFEEKGMVPVRRNFAEGFHRGGGIEFGPARVEASLESLSKFGLAKAVQPSLSGRGGLFRPVEEHVRDGLRIAVGIGVGNTIQMLGERGGVSASEELDRVEHAIPAAERVVRHTSRFESLRGMAGGGRPSGQSQPPRPLNARDGGGDRD